jgi:hypothetical protein
VAYHPRSCRHALARWRRAWFFFGVRHAGGSVGGAAFIRRGRASGSPNAFKLVTARLLQAQGDSRGCQILLLLGSANRDETVFPDGTSFEISRGNARNHLSFG